jgi:hypothetical protein
MRTCSDARSAVNTPMPISAATAMPKIGKPNASQPDALADSVT